MSLQTPSPPAADSAAAGVYVLIHMATTADEQGLYISRDASEIIELAWSIVSADDLSEIHKNSALIKPVNTPITPLCTSSTGITWDQVKDASSLKEGLDLLNTDIEKYALNHNLPFYFVTFNSWDLRMKLPKESREKSIAIPKYLEFSRYFDVKRECNRFQEFSNMNGEDQTIPVCTLTQAANLLIDSDNESDLFSSSVSRRASEEVDLLLKVVSQLKAKTAALSSLTFFKKPHDMNLDILQFLNEKSRILYMTNLPGDTTQSELESWFTQFGGRPIAFWTIKTPHIPTLPAVQSATATDSSSRSNSQVSIASLPQIPTSTGTNPSNLINTNLENASDSSSPSAPSSPAVTPQTVKPVNSGFVIFSSHEEAIESLAMNGRILNDKVIEVQPSSVRVLDKAQEILTPFPQSKNRPRPGDWTCPSCGFSNFQRRTACFRCSFPAASAVAIQESMYQSNNNNNNGQSNSTNNNGNNSGNSSSNGPNTTNAVNHTLQSNVYLNSQLQQNNNGGTNNQQGNHYQKGNSNGNMHMNNNGNKNHYNNNQMNNYNNNNYNNNNHYNGRSYSQPSQMNNGSMNSSVANNGMLNHNYNNHNNNGNNNSNNNNNGGNNIPFRAGDWKCINENCSYHNFAKNVCCLKCGAPRVQSAIVNGHAHNQHHNQQGSNGNQSSKSTGQQGVNNSYSNMSSPAFGPQSGRMNNGNNNKQNQNQLYRQPQQNRHNQQQQQQSQQQQQQQQQQQYTPIELHKTMSLPNQALPNNNSTSSTPLLKNLNDLVNTPTFAPLTTNNSNNSLFNLSTGVASAATSSLAASTLNLDNLASRIVGLNLNGVYTDPNANNNSVNAGSSSPSSSSANLNLNLNGSN